MAKKKRKKRPAPPTRLESPSADHARRVQPVSRAPAGAGSPSTPGWLTPAVVVACCLFVFWQLKPGLLFASNTPTGGDLGGQVWGPAQLKSFLPAFSGWTPQWFGGLAAYVLYMPMPALVVLLFNVVLPYGVALKLAVAISAIALPVAAYGLGRLSRLPAPIPACLAIAVIPFLLDDSYFKYGGNVLSSVIGEYGYGLGVPATLVALGLMDLVMRSGRWRASTTAVAALAALFHPAIALMLVICGVLLIAGHLANIGVLALRRIWPVVVFAPLIGAFWFLPFASYRSELDPLNYAVVGGWTSILFPLPAWADVCVVALALAGAVRAVRLRHPVSMMLAGTAVVCASSVLLFAHGVFGGWESHQTQAWVVGRMLPFWYLSLLLLAGIGAGDLFSRLAESRWPQLATTGPVAGLVVVVLSFGIITASLPLSDVTTVSTPGGVVTKSKWLVLPQVQRSRVPLWVGEFFNGYEGTNGWPEYHGLMDTMSTVGARHGCGRALAENDPGAMYGSIYEFALLPYWTNGCIDSMTGVPPDLSVNFTFANVASARLSYASNNTVQPGVGYPRLDVRRGVPLLRELGVRYFLAYSTPVQQAAAADRQLRLVSTAGPWQVYEVRGTAMVRALTRQPVVVDAASRDSLAWLDAAMPWFLDHKGAQLAGGGPPQWRRVPSAAAATPGPRLEPVKVSEVVVKPDAVSFHVDRTGVPVEIRTTYFPWWSTSGAQGPWRLAPDELVVVPTSHTVTVTASPRLVDHLSLVISCLAVLATIGLAVWDRRRRRATQSPTPATAV